MAIDVSNRKDVSSDGRHTLGYASNSRAWQVAMVGGCVQTGAGPPNLVCGRRRIRVLTSGRHELLRRIEDSAGDGAAVRLGLAYDHRCVGCSSFIKRVFYRTLVHKVVHNARERMRSCEEAGEKERRLHRERKASQLQKRDGLYCDQLQETLVRICWPAVAQASRSNWRRQLYVHRRDSSLLERISSRENRVSHTVRWD